MPHNLHLRSPLVLAYGPVYPQPHNDTSLQCVIDQLDRFPLNFTTYSLVPDVSDRTDRD